MIGMTVCSGIGGPEHAAPWIDWCYQSEIDKCPSAVLAARFPDAVNLGDMTKFKEWPDANVDVLCGGTPCQAFSVAGLREGLADPRGNLSLTYLAIADRYRPKWVVFENVPGIVSSTSHPAPDQCPPGIDLDGDDGPEDGEEVVVTDEYESDESHAFACFLAGLSELGYGFAYRVLDVQFGRTVRFPFAIPQRRRRVFVVGYLGDWRRAAAVLFDRESLSGNPAPRREAGKGTSHAVASSLGASGRGFERAGETRGQDPVVAVANSGDKAFTLCANSQNSLDAETETLIATVTGDGTAHALTGEGFDASEDGSGRGTPVIATSAYGLSTQQEPKFAADVAPTLARPSVSGGGQVTAVAFAQNQRGELRTSDVAPQLTTGGGKPGEGYPAVAFDMRGREGGAMPEGPHDTANIRAASGGSSRSYVAHPWAVRRLCPTECEKLMGFPVGWTAIPWRGKPAEMCPDGPRYKAIGNSWGVNAGEYIFDRIRMVESLPVSPSPRP